MGSELAKVIKYRKAELLRENNHGVTLDHSNGIRFSLGELHRYYKCQVFISFKRISGT